MYLRNQYEALIALSTTLKSAKTTQYYRQRFHVVSFLNRSPGGLGTHGGSFGAKKTNRQPLQKHKQNVSTSTDDERKRRKSKREQPKHCTAYLSVICRRGGKEGIEGVVAWDGEAGEVDEESSGDIEEDKEDVDACDAEEGVYLGH